MSSRGHEPARVELAPRANLVLGRGGVRGIAMVGAVIALHRAGWTFDRLGGISVGGIVAALLAAGYEPEELRAELWRLDLTALRDPRGRVPGVRLAGNLVTRLGLYRGDALYAAVAALLARKGVRTFADLRDPLRIGEGSPYRLRLLACDLTNARLVALPDDAARYGLEPDDIEIARAVRISASLPFVFEPVRFGRGATSAMLVDGGVVAGIPFDVFDSGRDESLPTIGIQAGPGSARFAGRPLRGLWSLARATYYAAQQVNAQALRPRLKQHALIDIDCGMTSAVAFRISDTEKQALFDAGFAAGRDFRPAQPRITVAVHAR